jgi:arylsulfatase A-like enzyme
MAFALEDVVDGIVATSARLRNPFFAYFHVLPPHEPYRPRREFVDLFRDGWRPPPKPALRFGGSVGEGQLTQLRREYDEYLAYADEEFGRLFQKLEDDGVLANTYLVLTSDHGQLFERGVHGHITRLLYEPLLHVPLIVWAPGQQHRSDVYEVTSSVDVLPTLLHLTGQAAPPWCEGAVLPPFAASTGRPVFAMEAMQNRKFAPISVGSLSCILGDYKLIRYVGSTGQEGSELYNLAADPEEMDDLFGAKPALARELEEQLNVVR